VKTNGGKEHPAIVVGRRHNNGGEWVYVTPAAAKVTFGFNDFVGNTAPVRGIFF